MDPKQETKTCGLCHNEKPAELFIPDTDCCYQCCGDSLQDVVSVGVTKFAPAAALAQVTRPRVARFAKFRPGSRVERPYAIVR